MKDLSECSTATAMAPGLAVAAKVATLDVMTASVAWLLLMATATLLLLWLLLLLLRQLWRLGPYRLLRLAIRGCHHLLHHHDGGSL